MSELNKTEQKIVKCELNKTEQQIVKCEYCKAEYTVEELFEESELTCVPEHWYCSKYCYDNDWEGI